jgi:hypothetical protein
MVRAGPLCEVELSETPRKEGPALTADVSLPEAGAER